MDCNPHLTCILDIWERIDDFEARARDSRVVRHFVQDQGADADGARRSRARGRVERQRQAGGAEHDDGRGEATLSHIAEYDSKAVSHAVRVDVLARDENLWALAELGLDNAGHDAGDDVGRHLVSREEEVERQVAKFGGCVEGRAGEIAGV